MNPRLGLIDYGSGNLRSVTKALERVGAQVARLGDGGQISDFAALVLPGVGSFGDSVKQLHARRMFEPVREWIREGRPFLGVCLGYQLLFERSEESPGVAGLGVLAGVVKRFAAGTPGTLKVPHIGWNQVTWRRAVRERFTALPERAYVYFVHSYYPEPADASVVAGTAEYGASFAAAVATKNVFATQFHPEKSQDAGLTILQEFVRSLA
ncbi:MAG: imidazole glycerol phosphate synthase subunit HisH [Verrucomicrobia bacterium]|nr:imidazole glycerol phosphate synthase subunit HisH [Verrucomicrobiota bacterium]